MKFFNYLRSIISANSNDSSKRFIALYSLGLVTYIVVAYVTVNNAIESLKLLLGFIAILIGVTAWQQVKNYNKNEKTNDRSDT